MPYSGRIRNPSTLQRLILEPYGDFQKDAEFARQTVSERLRASKSGQSILTYQG